MVAIDHAAELLVAEIDRRFRKPLLAFFRRRAHGFDAEDLTQEVLLRMARHPDIKAIESVQAFVFQVAANLLRDSNRRAVTHRQSKQIDIDEILSNLKLSSPLIEDIEPERVLLAKEKLAKVVWALGELPERTRDVFVLYRLEGLRQRAIASQLGISVSAVEKHLVRAFEHLALRVDRE